MNTSCSRRDSNPGLSRERAESLAGLDYRSEVIVLNVLLLVNSYSPLKRIA